MLISVVEIQRILAPNGTQSYQKLESWGLPTDAMCSKPGTLWDYFDKSRMLDSIQEILAAKLAGIDRSSDHSPLLPNKL